MTRLHTGEIPIDQVEAEFSMKDGRLPIEWKKWKMRRRRKFFRIMERAIGIEPTPEPWQGSRS
jgi:hypothetical protein